LFGKKIEINEWCLSLYTFFLNRWTYKEKERRPITKEIVGNIEDHVSFSR